MTGISVGDYRDPERGLELGDLMCEVARVPGVQRVRLSSVEVIHVKDSPAEALARPSRRAPGPSTLPTESATTRCARHGPRLRPRRDVDHIARVRAVVLDVNVTTDGDRRLRDRGRGGVRVDAEVVDEARNHPCRCLPGAPWPGTRGAETVSVDPVEKKCRSRCCGGAGGAVTAAPIQRAWAPATRAHR